MNKENQTTKQKCAELDKEFPFTPEYRIDGWFRRLPLVQKRAVYVTFGDKK